MTGRLDPEMLAASHSDQCSPTCPVCLSVELEAKGRATWIGTRLEDAHELERLAAKTKNPEGKAALKSAAIQFLDSVAHEMKGGG